MSSTLKHSNPKTLYSRSPKIARLKGVFKRMVLATSIITSLSGCYGYNENWRELSSGSQEVCVSPKEFSGRAALRIDGEPLIVGDKLPLDGKVYSVSYSDDGYLIVNSPDNSTSAVIPYLGNGTLNNHVIKWVDFSTNLTAYSSRVLISIDKVDYIMDELERVEFNGYTMEITSINLWDKAGVIVDAVIRGPNGEILHPLKLTPGLPNRVRSHDIILKDVSLDLYPNEEVDACSPVLVSAVLKVDDDYYVVVDEENPQQVFNYTVSLKKGFIGTVEDVSYDATDYAEIVVTDEIGSDKRYLIHNGDIINLKDLNGKVHDVELVNVVSKAQKGK